MLWRHASGMASSLTQTDVARLLAQPSVSVRTEVAGKLAQKIDSPVLGEAELQIAHDILRILAKDVELEVRGALSVSLRTARRLPHDVAMRLANDVDAVALPILTNSPVLTEPDLLELVAHSSSRKQAAIAGRGDVSETVADALTRQGTEDAVAALLANAQARIGDASLGTVIDRFGGSERVKATMVHRASLPATVAERLVAMVSENLQAYLVSHHDVPANLASDIVLQSRERATLAYSLGTDEQDLEQLVRHMHRMQRLTPLLVLRAICVGDTAFFEMAMAVMADVPIANARILIHDAGEKGLVPLYERTGMPARLLPAVRVALNVVHGTEFDGGERDKERYRSRVITRILTQFQDLPQDDVDYLLDRLGDVLTATAS
jgi:uncharacterized protein (DUF2336 family)